jgi:hypothetical protein
MVVGVFWIVLGTLAALFGLAFLRGKKEIEALLTLFLAGWSFIVGPSTLWEGYGVWTFPIVGGTAGAVLATAVVRGRMTLAADSTDDREAGGRAGALR